MHPPLIRSLALLGALLTCAVGCDEVADLDNFDVPVTAEATIEVGTPLEVLLGSFPQLDAFTRMDFAGSGAFENSGYSPADVDYIALSSLVMAQTAPAAPADLSFFGEVRFYLEAEGLPRIEIARSSSFPEGVREVAFDTTDIDLKDYLLAPEGGTITTEVDDTRRPDVETTLEIRAVFDVDVNVL